MTKEKRTLKVAITKAQAGKAQSEYKDKILQNGDLEENIIIIGSQMYQHDSLIRGALFRWDAGLNGKFMFIHQAMRKIFKNPDLNWTVVIYTAGYSLEQLEAMEVAIVNKIEYCRFVKVNVYDHVYNYINTQDVNDRSGVVSTARKANKIRRVYVYSHGIVFRLAIGITNRFSEDDDLDMTTANVAKLKKEGFCDEAKIYCFSCRTGLGNEKIDTEVYYDEEVSDGWFSTKTVRKYHNLYSAQSFAQKLADATNATVYAYLRRTEYSDTLNTVDELDFMDAYEAGTKGEKRARHTDNRYDYLLDKARITQYDIDRYKVLESEFKRRLVKDKAIFEPLGAKYPIRAAPTPVGVPDDMKTFTKINTK